MEVTLETTQGRRFTVEVWYFATVGRIKECILEREGIPVESQRLFFQGRELRDDDRDMEHHSILQGSHLLLLLPDDAPAAPAPAVVHVVASAPSLAVALDLEPSCTVARLKEALQDRTDGALPAARLGAFLGDAEMEDGRALAEFGTPGAGGIMEVRVVVRPPTPPPPAAKVNSNNNGSKQQQQRMSVEVRWGATAATVEVSDTDAVRELRARLGGALLLLPDDGGYFFVYKQNVMEEDRTLRWHDVKSGDTIEVFNGRVTGGV